MWWWIERFVPALAPLHEEARQVMRLLRYLVIVVIVLLALSGCVMLIRDLRILLSSELGSVSLYSEGLTSGMLVKTLILGMVGFFVPRMVWMYLIHGDPLIVFRHGRVTAATASLDADEPLRNLIADNAGALNETMDLDGYKQLLSGYEKWLIDNHVATRRVVTPIIRPLMQELDRLKAFWADRKATSKKSIFVMGRTNVGKTSVIGATFDLEHLESEIVLMFSGYSVRQYTVHDIVFYEFPGLNISIQSSSNGLDATRQGFVDLFSEFIKIRRTLPDMILHVASSKELHNVIKGDVCIIQECLFHMQLWALQSITPPLLCIITNADTVYPADLCHPDDYDDEKKYHLSQLKEIATNTIESENDLTQKGFRENLGYVPIFLRNVLTVSSRVFWIEKDSTRVPNPSRDYRYNLAVLKTHLNDLPKLSQPTFPGHLFTHRPFAVKFSYVYASLRRSSSHASLVTQYQFEAYTLLLIATDLATSSQLSTTQKDDLPTKLNSFFSALKLSTITYHSIHSLFSKTIQTHMPVLQLTGLFESEDRLIPAAIAFFVDGKDADCVRAVMAGTKKYL